MTKRHVRSLPLEAEPVARPRIEWGAMVDETFVPLYMLDDLAQMDDSDCRAVIFGMATYSLDAPAVERVLRAHGVISKTNRGSVYVTDEGRAWADQAVRAIIAKRREEGR